MPEKKKRKTGTSRKEKKRPDVETRLKTITRERKELEKAKNYSETVMSTMREPLVVLDADFRVVSANKAFYESFSVNQADVEGKVVFELGDKAWDLPKLRERLREVLTEGKTIDSFFVEQDFPVIGRRALLVNARPMAEESGQINKIVVTFNDVTDLKRAEEKIIALSRFPSENPNPVMRISKDGNVMYCNPVGLPILDEWKCQVGQSVPDDWRQLTMDVLKSGAKKEVEEEHGAQTFLMMFSPIVDAGYVNVYGREITKRKKAEEDLRKSEEMARQRAEELEKIMDLVPNALWVSRDPECRVITGNRAANQFYEAESGENVSAGPATGGEQDSTRRFFQNARELRPEELPMQEAATKGVEIRNSELDVLLPSGRKITILGSASPLKDTEGRVRGCVSSFMDITERKKAEEALLKAREELEIRVQERTKELEDATGALKAERKRFFDVLEKLPAYLVLLTPDHHVSYANRFFRERFGEDRGKRCYEYLFGRTEPCVPCETYKVLKNMAPLEWEWTGPDGRNYYIFDSPFTDIDGSTVIMEVGIDITERKQAEEALRKAHEELETRVEERTKDLTKATRELGVEVLERKHIEQALRESQIDLNRAQAVAKTGSWRLDVRSNELRWSDETHRMFGIPKGTPMTYEAFLSTVHPDDRGYVDQKWQAALHGEPYDIEHRIVAEGEVKWVREKAELEFDKDNVLLGGFGTVQDITERRKAEEELRETSDYLDSLLNYANAPIIVWDPEFKITKFNHAFEHLAGYKAEEVLSKHLSVLFPEKSREESLTEIQHTLAGEQWEGVEIPILRKDGDVRTVLWNSANIHAADEKTLMATIAQGQDITERKQLEEKLFQSERKYRSLYETSLDGIASADMEGCITECNDAYAQMLGYSKDELKNMSYNQLTPEKWHAMEQEIVREQVTKRGHSDLYEKELIRKDGSILPISIRVWLVRDERWTPIGMWAIVRDITRTKQLENELKRYSEHLEHLVEERTKKLKDAERLAAIGETAAMVGHDIRNPLQSVEGSVYLAKEEIKSMASRTEEINTIEEMLNTIQQETAYIDKIVSDLQDYARPVEPQLEEINTQQLINGTMATIKIPPNIDVSVTVEQDCCAIVVDGTMMKRILTNLITNALQAMPNGGKLIVTAVQKQDEVHIGIQDTGQGIPEEDKAKIFHPLFSTKAKGQGFGLAVVKRLVEAHNGTIGFNSEVGKGTIFNIAIPIAKEEN